MATMVEAKPFVLGMSLKKWRQQPFSVFKNEKVILVISDIGKANAAMAAAYCCQSFNPSCIVNLGAAGASGFSHPLGEVFHINKIFEYDRPELKSLRPTVHLPEILDGFQTSRLAGKVFGAREPEERKEISGRADLMDMEGASIVQACKKFRTKCYLFKFVSDTPEHIQDNDIIKNIRLYRTTFFEFFQGAVLPAIST